MRSRSRRTWPAAASTSSSVTAWSRPAASTCWHRAPRGASDRQPVPRPFRPPGRPGETRFYLSGEDDLVRLFAGDRIKRIMERFKIPDDQPMEAKILSGQIEGAQKKVEEQNFVARKNVLKYDDVMNIAAHGDLRAAARRCWRARTCPRRCACGSRGHRAHRREFTQEEYAEEWDLEGLVKQMATLYASPRKSDHSRRAPRGSAVRSHARR